MMDVIIVESGPFRDIRTDQNNPRAPEGLNHSAYTCTTCNQPPRLKRKPLNPSLRACYPDASDECQRSDIAATRSISLHRLHACGGSGITMAIIPKRKFILHIVPDFGVHCALPWCLNDFGHGFMEVTRS